ncbi:fused MFS/spermidine synthase [Euzebya sp.]|uniref:fused MFS/spermidine synthase n=1 Tax=Euzebya sp. TaxID=1971409 RepID=UPI0035171B51
MPRARGGRHRRRPPSADTAVGHAEVRADPARPRAGTLMIDGAVHGHVDPQDPARLALDYQDRLAALALALAPDDGGTVLHLGGGAFAIPRAIAVRRPDLHQPVVARTGAIIRLAQRELGLRPGPGLEVRKADARKALARIPDDAVDVVVGDAFEGQETPAHLTTVEFMADVARVLTPGGAYVVNVVDDQPWGRLGVQVAAARAVFADVVAAGSPGVAALRDPGNVFLLAGAALPRRALAAVRSTGRHVIGYVAPGRLDALARRHRPRHDADGLPDAGWVG